MLVAWADTCCSASSVLACCRVRAVCSGLVPWGWPAAMYPAVRSRSSSMFWVRLTTSALSWASCWVRLSASALLTPELMRRPPRITAARVGTTIRARMRHRTRQLLRARREPERAGAGWGASAGSPATGAPEGPPGAVNVAVPPLPSPTVAAPAATWVPLVTGPSLPSRSPVTGLLRTALAPRTNRGLEYSLGASVAEAAQHRTPLSRATFTVTLIRQRRRLPDDRGNSDVGVAKRVRTYNHLPATTHGVFASNFVQRCDRWRSQASVPAGLPPLNPG